MYTKARVAFLVLVLVAVVLLSFLTPARWSPYTAGAVIGMLCWLTFLISDKELGVSATYVRISGFIARLLHKQAVDDNEYYQDTGVKLDWQMMLLLGVFLGALVSAVGSESFHMHWVPGLWQDVFGDAVVPRLLIAFVGGVFVALGARWAGGCTSGQGITGTLQMSVAGWLAAICFFIGGIITATIIYGSGGTLQ